MTSVSSPPMDLASSSCTPGLGFSLMIMAPPYTPNPPRAVTGFGAQSPRLPSIRRCRFARWLSWLSAWRSCCSCIPFLLFPRSSCCCFGCFVDRWPDGFRFERNGRLRVCFRVQLIKFCDGTLAWVWTIASCIDVWTSRAIILRPYAGEWASFGALRLRHWHCRSSLGRGRGRGVSEKLSALKNKRAVYLFVLLQKRQCFTRVGQSSTPLHSA